MAVTRREGVSRRSGGEGGVPRAVVLPFLVTYVQKPKSPTRAPCGDPPSDDRRSGLCVSGLRRLRCSNKLDDPMDDQDDGASEKSVGQRILSASARARKALSRLIHTDMEDGGAEARAAGARTVENGQSLADRAARVQARDEARASANENVPKVPAAAATKSSKSKQPPRARQLSNEDDLRTNAQRAEDEAIGLSGMNSDDEPIDDRVEEKSAKFSTISESSTIREFRDVLASHGLSLMSEVIITEMGIESVAELEGYTFESFSSDLIADAPDFVMKRAQSTKLKKLLAVVDGYVPLGLVDASSQLPSAATVPEPEPVPTPTVTKKAAKKARKAAAAAPQPKPQPAARTLAARASAAGSQWAAEHFDGTYDDVPADAEPIDVPGDEPSSFNSLLSASPSFDGCDLVMEMLISSGVSSMSEAEELVFTMVEKNVGMTGMTQIELASDVLEELLLNLDRASIEWRASDAGVRRAHTSFRAAVSQYRALQPSLPPPAVPPAMAPPKASSEAPAPSQAAVSSALFGSLFSNPDAKKEQSLEHVRATERVKTVEASTLSTQGLARLQGAIESLGEDHESFLELHASVVQQNPALAALLKTTKIPKPSGAHDALGLLGVGGADAGKAERLVSIAKAACYVQEHIVHALSESVVLPRLGADGACQRLAKAACYGQLATISVSNGVFKLDELEADASSKLVPGRDTDAKGLIDKSSELLSLVLSEAHPTDTTIQATFADVSSKATGTSGKGKDHNLVYGALFRSYAALWDRFQHTQAPYPTLRDAWKRAQTSDRVREAGSAAAEQTQAMATKLAALEAADAARSREMDTLKSQLATLKTARAQPTQTRPPAGEPDDRVMNKVCGLARKKLHTDKSDLQKQLGEKRRALASASDADKPAVQSEIDALALKPKAVQTKLDEKA